MHLCGLEDKTMVQILPQRYRQPCVILLIVTQLANMTRLSGCHIHIANSSLVKAVGLTPLVTSGELGEGKN
jgi:hypothetical protein